MLLRSARRAGFTILEILIAIVVLVLGITGIIALFPTAIESGNKTVEDSYAAAITQSVVDALSVGVRESRYNTVHNNRVYTYFIFNHDGVVDQAPNTPAVFTTAMDGGNNKQGAIWRRDFCIILPSATVAGDNKDLLKEPNFVYPVPSYVADNESEANKNTDPGLNQRSPTKLGVFGGLVDNLHVDFQRPATAGGAKVPWYSRVFHLGRYREALEGQTLPISPDGVQMLRGDIRLEYRGDAIATGGTTTEQTIAVDPYPSYSFCFTLQRARVDTNGAGPTDPPDGRLTQSDSYSDTLYQLRVMIFKNFDPDAAYQLRPSVPGDQASPPAGPDHQSVPRTNVPIRDFVTLIAL
jgi:Tfp pilus assembly protein PilV